MAELQERAKFWLPTDPRLTVEKNKPLAWIGILVQTSF
jgi:hypothetical protein